MTMTGLYFVVTKTAAMLFELISAKLNQGTARFVPLLHCSSERFVKYLYGPFMQ